MGDKQDDELKVASTADVLAAEYGLIWQTELAAEGSPRDREAAYRKAVLARDQAALCLSGGGIRSAAFALGVLQALSVKNLLTHFQYLSTVSGGGYIGSWLQRWIHDEGDAERVMFKLGAVTEAPEVAALRENSNFITPRVGIGSNDTWTALSISGRNITLNWLLFAPLLMFVTVFPNLFAASVLSLPIRASQMPGLPWLTFIALGTSAAFAFLAAWKVCRALPSYRASTAIVPSRADGWLTTRIVFPLVGWSITGTLSIAIDLFNEAPVFGIAGLALALVSLLASILGLFASGFTLPGTRDGQTGHAASEYQETFASDIGMWLIALAVAAAVTVLGAGLFERWLGAEVQEILRNFPKIAADPVLSERQAAVVYWHQDLPQLSPVALLTVLGPLWLMSTQLLIAIVFAGFREASGKTIQPDSDREWLARLSAVKIKPMLLWAVVGFAVLILGWALGHYIPGFDMSLSGLVAAISGFVAVGGGKSEKSGNSTSALKGVTSRVMKILPRQAVIAIGTAVFILMLFLILGRIEQNAAAWIASNLNWEGRPAWVDPAVVAHAVLLVILSLLLFFLQRRIHVNRFSLNGLYRNRLARAFLGGARRERRPDPFTGFDPADNVRMHSLTPKALGRTCLYPIVNIALNVTASEKLAWQERKAEPFVFTPRFSGSAMLKPPEWPPRDGTPYDLSEPPGAYLSSAIYGGNEPDLAMEGCGVSLATAMSISGAAASPNMGYHTSAATALLMTLFNVRLGAWLPNPAQAKEMGKKVRASGPSNSLRAVLRELAGATDDRGWDLYLSDGGHFENLGLYEMVRRRCRYIVVSDAGADPDCAFSDLGGAVRKVKIDLDVDIAFAPMRIASRKSSPLNPGPQYAYALGTIEYPETRQRPEVEGNDPDPGPRHGRILYIKPSFFGDLPVDVVSYAAGSETFPHESTADQFFSESQFESYRRLGYFFASALGGDFNAHDVPDNPVGRFFDAIDAQLVVAQEARGGRIVEAVRAMKRRVSKKKEDPA
ncbi:MAG TPA: patatin-like phospholipase family protein [Allosphingosinicella sp.]|nr:patatin-like phospholipase family protein [Allosphingosinicella sp.]